MMIIGPEITSQTDKKVVSIPEETLDLYSQRSATRYASAPESAPTPPGTFADEGYPEMDDKDVRRLEDRIEASSREANLRLDTALAKIETATVRINEQNNAIISQLHGNITEVSNLRIEMRENSSNSNSITRSWGTWIIATVLVVAFGFIAVEIGLRQVWVGGVQVGQAMYSDVASQLAPLQADPADHASAVTQPPAANTRRSPR